MWMPIIAVLALGYVLTSKSGATQQQLPPTAPPANPAPSAFPTQVVLTAAAMVQAMYDAAANGSKK